MPIRVSNIEKLLEEYLKRDRKEDNGIESEDQIDRVQGVEQVDNSGCNSDEEGVGDFDT